MWIATRVAVAATTTSEPDAIHQRMENERTATSTAQATSAIPTSKYPVSRLGAAMPTSKAPNAPPSDTIR
jgi:hypothetical protein